MITQPPSAHEEVPRSDGSKALLTNFVEQVFRPLLLRYRNPRASKCFRAAVAWLSRSLARHARICDLNRDNLARLAEPLAQLGPGRGRDQRVANFKQLLELWEFAFYLGYASPVDAPEIPTCREPRRGAGFRLPTLVGEPGTVVHFFGEVFWPQVLATASVRHIAKFRTLMVHLRNWRPDDLHLDELSRPLLADFTLWLNGRGLHQRTVVHLRRLLLQIWRYAHELNVAQAPPQQFARLRIPREVPDAWDLGEIAAIVEAAGKLNRPPIRGVPAAHRWKALVLVGWYTGLRRGTLLRLRKEWVNLTDGWITVPAVAMKTCVGKKFRVGVDAIAALRLIWDATPDGERLFPLSNKNCAQHFAHILELAGVAPSSRPNGQFHKLRRSTATHVAVAAGLAAAAALLGHTTQELLARYIDPRYVVGNDATAWLSSPADPGAASPRSSRAREQGGYDHGA